MIPVERGDFANISNYVLNIVKMKTPNHNCCWFPTRSVVLLLMSIPERSVKQQFIEKCVKNEEKNENVKLG